MMLQTPPLFLLMQLCNVDMKHFFSYFSPYLYRACLLQQHQSYLYCLQETKNPNDFSNEVSLCILDSSVGWAREAVEGLASSQSIES